MSIQVKRAIICCFKFSWAHPIISILLCSSGLVGVLFPEIFKCVVSFIPLIVSTYMFLAAIVSVGPQSKAPASLTKTEKASAQSHQDDGHKETELKQFPAISRQGEPQIADWKEQTRTEIVETVEEQHQQQKPTEKFEDVAAAHINNSSRNLVEFELPEELEPVEANGDQQEAISIHERTARDPLYVIAQEAEEEKESIPIDQTKLSLGLGAAPAQEDNDRQSEVPSEAEGGGEGVTADEDVIRLENFFSMPLKSCWKSRFESSSDSLSEASSLGSLGPLFDDLDPLLLTDEEDDGNASTKVHKDEDDQSAVWAEEDDVEENLFDLVHDNGSDSSSSEEENLIEIELSDQQQIVNSNEEETHQHRLGSTEHVNVDDLDYSDDKEKLRGQNFMDYVSEEGDASAFPEEENLIEIDLSADTVVAQANEEINTVKIQSDSATKKEKVSPIYISSRKEHLISDLLSDQSLNTDSSYKTQLWKDVWLPNNIIPYVPTTTADLIDLNSPSVLELTMAGSEDDQSKPEKTEAESFFSTKAIQIKKVPNLLD